MKNLLLVSLVLLGCSRWDREPKTPVPAPQAAPAPSPEAENARTMARIHAYARTKATNETAAPTVPSFQDLDSEYAWLSERIEKKEGILNLSGSKNDAQPLTNLRGVTQLTGVKTLIARNQGVEFSALSDIALAVDLEALDLSESRGDRIDFEALARFFPNLESLTLDDCGFESDEAIELEALSRLTELSLRKNRLTRIPYSLPKNLMALNLEKNKITGPFDKELLRFLALDSLNLDHNQLQSLKSDPAEAGPVFPETLYSLRIKGNPEAGSKLLIGHYIDERSAGRLRSLLDFPLDETLMTYARKLAAEKTKHNPEPKP